MSADFNRDSGIQPRNLQMDSGRKSKHSLESRPIPKSKNNPRLKYKTVALSMGDSTAVLLFRQAISAAQLIFLVPGPLRPGIYPARSKG
ncbi:hypothetical protein AML91_04380 [Paenibacillus jilunlii]|uniref:Uncharacterized protein n=1 Tax=Paenibacillus jilunlii TaxID=682956 RepID=A0ABR5T006_9BACL|nr:hypothetical protein AML91_04380 [Paenibacillus jilunlii]